MPRSLRGNIERIGTTETSAYERLAEALGELPNEFPRTPSGVELRILEKIFSLEEAALACQLTRRMEPAEVIAERFESPVEETEKKLADLVQRGLVWSDSREGTRVFRLAPFIVGIYEEQLNHMDHELAHLVEDYLDRGGAAGIMTPQPALHRVVPAQDSVKPEMILPYEDVKALLLQSDRFRLRECICRVQQDHIGRKCHFPLKTCLVFSSFDAPPHPDEISQEDALALLGRMERIGLVHTVSNVMEGLTYVCNCCGCCCELMRGITKWGIEQSVAASNYFSVIDPDECLNCGVCVERCQVKAISELDGHTVVNREKCIGCGLCVSGCPTDAARLERKPTHEIVNPPVDFGAWETERLRNRGSSLSR